MLKRRVKTDVEVTLPQIISFVLHVRIECALDKTKRCACSFCFEEGQIEKLQKGVVLKK